MLCSDTKHCRKSIKQLKDAKKNAVCLRTQKIFVPLHRQKVNRLFRLVVIDLGF